MSTAKKPHRFIGLDQTRAPVDYEGGAYDPGTCPECGSDDPRQTAAWLREEGLVCPHRFHEFCDRPPEGWFCTRPRHHDGPCAAHPKADPLPPFWRLLWYVAVERFGKTGAWALVTIQATVLVQFGVLVWLIFFS